MYMKQALPPPPSPPAPPPPPPPSPPSPPPLVETLAGYPKWVGNSAVVWLPSSAPSTLLTLRSVGGESAGCPSRAVARSYDGNTWEGLPPNPLHPTCNRLGRCTVDLSTFRCPYRIDAVAHDPAGTDVLISRLLTQATFGPTRAAIADFKAAYGVHAVTGPASWVASQLALPPTLLRTYLRERSNPRQLTASRAGGVIGACEKGSRWHGFSFSMRDRFETLAVWRERPKLLSLRVNGVLRTEVPSFHEARASQSAPATHQLVATYVLCEVWEAAVGQDATLLLARGAQQRMCTNSGIREPNPDIHFSPTSPVSHLRIFGARDARFEALAGVPSVLILRSLADKQECTEAGRQVGGAIFAQVNGKTYKFDARLRLLGNTLEAPATGDHLATLPSLVLAGGPQLCPRPSKSFANAVGCSRRPACAPSQFANARFKLDATALQQWYHLSGRHVHYMTGLRLEVPYAASPCFGHARWLKLSDGACASPTHGQVPSNTKWALANAITGAIDKSNPRVRDVVGPGGRCSGGVGAVVSADGGCWQHVHPHTLNTYDMTDWSAADAELGDPIRRASEAGHASLTLPVTHTMWRWKDQSVLFPLLGRFGDVVRFDELPFSVQTLEMATRRNALTARTVASEVEFCGSPGETANRPELGHLYPFMIDLRTNIPAGQRWQASNEEELDHPAWGHAASTMLWTNVALTAPDQLRQRTAWALIQILVVSNVDGFGRHDEIELWATYYDIFVRHAFGNYRDVLKEVAFSPLMGMYLTHMDNKAFAFDRTFPDENFAREIMQLFTIGFWRLNRDGTQMLDVAGRPVPTYDNVDVMTFASVWTGLTPAPSRTNIEIGHDEQGFSAGSTLDSRNELDPMVVEAVWHDKFPKSKLDAGYLADQLPLCAELPRRHFLARGAVYRLLGEISAEGAAFDANPYTQDSRLGRFAPNPRASQLHAALCARPSRWGACSFPAEVKLSQTLPCHEEECLSDRVRSVRIDDPVTGTARWYEHVRPPCARLTFSNGRRYTSFKDYSVPTSGPKHSPRPERHFAYHQCADPSAPVAAPMCCDRSDSVTPLSTIGRNHCLYAGEFVKYATAEARCAQQGAVLCTSSYRRPRETTPASFWEEGCGEGMYAWTSTPCRLQVQVHADGLVNLVESVPDGHDAAGLQGGSQLEETKANSEHKFRIRWERNRWPRAPGGCGWGCTAGQGDGAATCICDVRVDESAVFTDVAAGVPSSAAIGATLFIGAMDPEHYGAADGSPYQVCTSAACRAAAADGVTVHMKTARSGSTLVLDRDTIFRISLRGKTLHLLNRVSTVRIASGQYSFRNPPHHMPLAGERWGHQAVDSPRWLPWQSSFASDGAMREIDALIDSLFEHDTMPPFLAVRLIQRLSSSNPSPRYVEVVADAFSAGVYAGETYGGRYGDLGAAIAAIFLDREARSATLDADPLAGRLREPLLKVLHTLRAMEYRAKAGREVDLREMQETIGQAAFESPSVFNFYLPEYQPVGPIADAGLVAPEAQLLSAPYIVGLMNGLSSLIEFGLTSCEDGFGQPISRPERSCGKRSSGRYDTADGNLTFAPSDPSLAYAVVDELALLLTDGRLGATSRDVVVRAYAAALSGPAPESGATPAQEALKVAQKLIVATPEFHTTSLDVETETRRRASMGAPSRGRPFRAVVVLYLRGGLDSFNALVPHTCPGRDLYADYKRVRTNIALPKADLLPVSARGSDQPCTTFGLHPQLTAIRDAYDDGDAIAVANIGTLVEPITKAQYEEAGSVQLPPQLFAHNVQERAVNSLHAQAPSAQGVLGRAMAALETQAAPYRSRLFSIAGSTKILEGSPREPDFIQRKGMARYHELANLAEHVDNITATVSTSAFTNTYKGTLKRALSSTEELGGAMQALTLATEFAGDRISMQFSQVARALKLREKLQLERAGFFTLHGGFDTHFDAIKVTNELLGEVNTALRSFVAELKAQGLWESVTIVTLSEFGRSLSSNGRGTDHGWGGNVFLMGGALKGGRVLGRYPSDITRGGDLDVGRGRMLPSSSWETLWNGLTEWLGVEEGKIDGVLPNRKNFPRSQLFSAAQMFER